jgi:hypothetical protein
MFRYIKKFCTIISNNSIFILLVLNLIATLSLLGLFVLSDTWLPSDLHTQTDAVRYSHVIHNLKTLNNSVQELLNLQEAMASIISSHASTINANTFLVSEVYKSGFEIFEANAINIDTFIKSLENLPLSKSEECVVRDPNGVPLKRADAFIGLGVLTAVTAAAATATSKQLGISMVATVGIGYYVFTQYVDTHYVSRTEHEAKMAAIIATTTAAMKSNSRQVSIETVSAGMKFEAEMVWSFIKANFVWQPLPGTRLVMPL